MTQPLGIQSLTLSGFQVFDQKTTIPLSRLTLLYGPNSAGKSAVEDALALLGQLTRPKSELGDTSDYHWWDELLLKNWRRVEGFPASFSDTLELDAEFIFDGSFLAEIGNYFQHAVLPGGSYSWVDSEVVRGAELDSRGKRRRHNSYDLSLHENSEEGCTGGIRVQLKLVFQYERDELGQFMHIRHSVFQLDIDDCPVISLQDNWTLGLNLAHPAISFFEFELRTDFQSLAERHEQDLSLMDGWIYIHNVTSLAPHDGLDLSMYSYGWMWEHEDSIPSDVLTAMQEVKALLESFLKPAWRYIHREVTATVVPASRTVPTNDQLVFLIDTRTRETSSVFCVSDSGAPHYRDLAESFASPYLEDAEASANVDDHDQRLEMLASNVNRSLTDHLFRERAYQIEADFRLIYDPQTLNETIENGTHTTGDERDYAILVRLYLADPQQRRYAFIDVGSGLGYILPVLCEAWGKGHLVLIQQPELHLHPALQSELADVFIEASNEFRTLIVETHSEHLLLRLLRRIRQTARGQLNTPELMLRPKDVTVLYFDPQMDGTTKVRQLRISDDGEFIDLWPRGFFAERWEELFDE